MTNQPSPVRLMPLKPRHVCPGGNRCCLRDDPTTDGKHTLCICSDPRCECHSQERYDAERHSAPGALD